MPMMSFLPAADRLRADLNFLFSSDGLGWVDVTALGFICAYALCDSGAILADSPANPRWPVVFSAAFSQTLINPRWWGCVGGFYDCFSVSLLL